MAAKHTLNGDFGMLPVTENDRMIGAISNRDIALGDFAVVSADIKTAGETLAEISKPD